MKIRYYGHVGQATGFGRAAEATCMAILTTGYELEVRSLAPAGQELRFHPSCLPVATHLRKDHELDPSPDVVIVHTLPMDTARVLELAHLVGFPPLASQTQEDLIRALASGVSLTNAHLVVYTAWEASALPPTAKAALGVFDQVWWPSYACGGAWRDDGGKTGGNQDNASTWDIVPHAFDAATWDHRRTRLDDTSRYRFYYHGAFNSRKNVHGLIRAYAHAFKPDDPVSLVIRSQTTADTIIAAVASTGLALSDMARLEFNGEYASDEHLVDLHRSSHCYVTASRGEGWNLPAFDAMVAGNQVITPFGQGSDDYLASYGGWHWCSAIRSPAHIDTRIKRPVDGGFEVETVGAQGLTARQMWLEPDLYDLAGGMRHVYANRAEHAEEVADPEWQRSERHRILDSYSYAAVGVRIKRLLERALNQ